MNGTTYLGERNDWQIGLVTFLIILVLVVALFGNLIVMLVVVQTNKLRGQLSNWFIINLAISDISNAIVVMSTAAVSTALDFREVNKIWCKITCSSNYCLMIASMLTMLFIGLDRYLAIIHALSYKRIVTKRRVQLVLGYTWFQGLAFSIPPSLTSNWIEYDYWEAVCAINWGLPGTVLYVILACILCFALPFLLLIYFYCGILKIVRDNSVSHAYQAGSGRERKQIISLLLVVILFFVFMAPFCITKLLKVLGYEIDGWWSTGSAIAQYMASACNPFIYAIFREDMRKALKYLWMTKVKKPRF